MADDLFSVSRGTFASIDGGFALPPPGVSANINGNFVEDIPQVPGDYGTFHEGTHLEISRQQQCTCSYQKQNYPAGMPQYGYTYARSPPSNTLLPEPTYERDASYELRGRGTLYPPLNSFCITNIPAPPPPPPPPPSLLVNGDLGGYDSEIPQLQIASQFYEPINATADLRQACESSNPVAQPDAYPDRDVLNELMHPPQRAPNTRRKSGIPRRIPRDTNRDPCERCKRLHMKCVMTAPYTKNLCMKCYKKGWISCQRL